MVQPLLVLCVIGGMAGFLVGCFRRDVSTAMLGLIVIAISAFGIAA